MSRSRKKSKMESWNTYGRCFILTAGILFGAVAAFGLREMLTDPEAPAWAWALVAFMGTFAAAALVLGILGSRETVSKYCDHAPAHEGSILIAIIAAPLYFFFSLFE